MARFDVRAMPAADHQVMRHGRHGFALSLRGHPLLLSRRQTLGSARMTAQITVFSMMRTTKLSGLASRRCFHFHPVPI